MSNNEKPNEYFASNNRAEARVREYASAVKEADVLYDYVVSPDNTRYSLGDSSIVESDLLNIYFTNGTSQSFEPEHLTTAGLFVKDFNSDDVSLLRGTIYTIDITEIRDQFTYGLLQKSFNSKNYPITTIKVQSHSLPLVAAKGQIGFGGYLVFTRLFSPKQFDTMTSEGRARNRSRYIVLNNTKFKGYVMEDCIEYIPNRISNMTLLDSAVPDAT